MVGCSYYKKPFLLELIELQVENTQGARELFQKVRLGQNRLRQAGGRG
jgi:hypothetical protein